MPIIGHMHLLRDYQHNPWEGFNAIRKEYGDVVALKMGIHPMLLVSSRQAIQEILLDKSAIFADRPTFPRHHIIFGGDKENSLALCNWSNTHRERRKLCKRGIVPNKFSSRNHLLETIVCQRTKAFIQHLSSPISESIAETQKQTLLTKMDLLLLTSDIFLEFLCGGEQSHARKVYRDFAEGCDFVFWDINQSYLIDFLPFLTSLGVGYFHLKRLKDETDFLRNFIDDEIFDPRLAEHKRLIDIGSEPEPNSIDYLDSLILEYLSGTTSMSLPDYKVGFADLLAGHAAVANILIRVLGHLALDEKIQDLICDEAEKADLFNLTHKPSLPITEASLLEALRLASSPIVPHVARENTSVGQFFVPAGSMVLFNIYYQNLSEDIWKNSHDFDPLRFIHYRRNELGDSVPKLQVPKHFMPFSVGMRQCLGQKMVETTSIVTIANLCRKFIIRPNKEHLVRELLSPKGCVALNPDVECFELKLVARCCN